MFAWERKPRTYALEHRETGEHVSGDSWMTKVGQTPVCAYCPKRLFAHSVCYRINGKLSHVGHWKAVYS